MTLDTHNDGYNKSLEVLAIDTLDTDHRYQRDLDQGLVERILKDWDYGAADALKVSLREDGTYWIINGQHTAAAAALSGETEILCFVYTGLTVEQEADIRLKSNNRRSDTAQERFHAQITKQDPETLAIVAILDSFNAHVNRSPNKHTGINCVSTLEALYRDDVEIFTRTLKALTEAYGTVQGDVALSHVIRATFWFLKVHVGEYHWRSFIDRVRDTGYDELWRRTNSHRSVAGGANWLNYYRALVEMYNFRRAEHTRIELKTKYSASISPSGWKGSGASRRSTARATREGVA